MVLEQGGCIRGWGSRQGEGIALGALEGLQDSVGHPGELRLGQLEHLARLGRHKHEREVQPGAVPVPVQQQQQLQRPPCSIHGQQHIACAGTAGSEGELGRGRGSPCCVWAPTSTSLKHSLGGVDQQQEGS